MPFLKEKIALAAEEAELKAQSAYFNFPKYLKRGITLLILGALPVYFIAGFASQKYWEHRYSQYLITANPSFQEAKDLTVGSATLINLSNNIYSAAAEIGNENFELSLENQAYEFRFFDREGKFVSSVSGNFYILPGEKKYLVVPRLEAQGNLHKAELSIIGKQSWQKRLSLAKVNLITSIPDLYAQGNPDGLVAEGSVTNNSPYEIKEIKLVFLVYNSSGKLIGADQRSEFALQPYERRSYKQIWPDLAGVNARSVKITAETNPLDPGNLTVAEPPEASSSSLDRPKANPY